jgi:hypothetical protein
MRNCHNDIFGEKTRVLVPEGVTITNLQADCYYSPDQRGFGYDEHFNDLTNKLDIEYVCADKTEVNLSWYYRCKTDYDTRYTPTVECSVDVHINDPDNRLSGVCANWEYYTFCDNDKELWSCDDDWQCPNHPLLLLDRIYAKYCENFEDLCDIIHTFQSR